MKLQLNFSEKKRGEKDRCFNAETNHYKIL